MSESVKTWIVTAIMLVCGPVGFVLAVVFASVPGAIIYGVAVYSIALNVDTIIFAWLNASLIERTAALIGRSNCAS